uniref:Uncharacterized protein n=1 Tax=Clytia hemisphaerica TaxID=252671 RepID=A0A7M5VHC6_9CNID
MLYVLFKYVEKNGKIREGVAPASWIKENKLYWPKYGADALAKEGAPLDERWPSYDLHEVKKYDDDFQRLNICQYSTTENDSPVKKKPDNEPSRASSPQFNISSSYQNSFKQTLPGAMYQNEIQPGLAMVDKNFATAPINQRRECADPVVRSSCSPLTGKIDNGSVNDLIPFD